MKRLSIFLLFAVTAIACNKDDDSDDNQNPSDDTPSFSLQSSDGSLDMSGTAILNPSFGIDSLISIVMTSDNGQANASLALYGTGDAWDRDQYSIGDNTIDSSQIFLLSLNVDSLSTSYFAYEGDISITSKTKNKQIAGDIDVKLFNPMNGDTLNTTGSFNALSQF